MIIFAITILACKSKASDSSYIEEVNSYPAPTISSADYGMLEYGTKVEVYAMKNGQGR